MFYLCKDCLKRFSTSHVYWIRESGKYICCECLRRDNQLRVEYNLSRLEVQTVTQCERV
jgi:hypothetical protein